MRVRIRRPDPSEAAELTAVAFAAKRYWSYPEEWIELWADELEVSAAYITSHEVFAAYISGHLVGWYALDRSESGWSLDYCWVRPEMIGRGIGRRLLAHAKEEMKQAGIGKLTVVTDPNAEGFYKKMGFERVGEYPSRPEGRMLPLMQYRSVA